MLHLQRGKDALCDRAKVCGAHMPTASTAELRRNTNLRLAMLPDAQRSHATRVPQAASSILLLLMMVLDVLVLRGLCRLEAMIVKIV